MASDSDRIIIPEMGTFVKHWLKDLKKPSSCSASGPQCFVKESKTGYNTPHEYTR